MGLIRRMMVPVITTLGCALYLSADTQFQARRMTRNDVPLGQGQCDIRLQIDGETEVSVRGNVVSLRTITGRDGRDDGSECNEPLPGANVRGFNYRVMDSRGELRLLQAPSPRNGGRAVVRIRDTKGGMGRYHFRLTWSMVGGGVRPPIGGPGNRPGFPGNPGPSRAIDICQSAVRSQISSQYKYQGVDFRNTRIDNRPGRNDYILGDAIARRGFSNAAFSFVCRVDLSSGRVRSVDVRPR